MALPTSPSVVVLENDQSIYTPNVQSSVVGIVGFADKGPINKATLITSQNQLLNVFGKPSSDIPGQGLEGALEILEATNQVYFVRVVQDAGAAAAANATVSATLGFCPAVQVSSTTSTLDGSTLTYVVTDNYSEVQLNGSVQLASATGDTGLYDVLKRQFDPQNVGDSPVFAMESDGALFLASRYAGANSRLELGITNASSYFSAINVSGGSIAPIQANTIVASGGTAQVSGASGIYVKFESNYPGTGYNLVTLKDGTIQGVSIEVDSKSIRDIITVNNNASLQETFSVDLIPSSVGFIETLLVNDPINNKSEYVYAEIESNGTAYTPNDNFADKLDVLKNFTYLGALTSGTPRFVKIVEGTYNLANGQSGYSTTASIVDDWVATAGDTSALIGTATGKKGLYALDDDGLNISIALIPGITNQQVQNALITLAETSRNFIAVMAPPYGLDNVQETVDWMNGRGTRTAALNSSWAAVYWPWVQVFNYFAAADEWYDPSIFAARQMVFTDSVSEPWFAPAGVRRGRLTKPTSTESDLGQGDKDALYSNNINPITREVGVGITVFGQKTTQRAPTALDRVNVRRLMIYIRKVLLQLGKPFQFEPNDALTWEAVEDSINPFLSDLLARRAIVEGAVKCDSTTNTPLRVDRNELWCSITIKPTKAAETVVFEVNLTNQSATING
jgi:phage tail sheath protein FI